MSAHDWIAGCPSQNCTFVKLGGYLPGHLTMLLDLQTGKMQWISHMGTSLLCDTGKHLQYF